MIITKQTSTKKRAIGTHSWDELGRRIRDLREDRGISLAGLAEKTGLSRGMISQLERGLTTPSLGSLRSISLALSTPLSALFQEPARIDAPSYIVYSEQRSSLQLRNNKIIKHLISPKGMREMEAYTFELDAGASSGSMLVGGKGEKFGYVLSGRLVLWLDGISYKLAQNDSFHFPAAAQHKFENGWKRKTKILWMLSSPLT